MAEVFSKHNKDHAIYTVSAGWLYWNEKKWEVSELKVMHLYIETAKKVLKNANYEFREAYAKLMQAEMDGAKDVITKAKSEANRAKQYLTFAKKINDHGKVSGILKLGKSMLEVPYDKLDSDPFILNTPDGIVDLKTGKIKEHSS